MTKIMIQFCISNELCDDISHLNRLKENFADAEIVPVECLDHCVLCEQYPYVILNGEIVSGNTVEQLFENLDQKISLLKEQL